ncbi:LysM domain-containing protein [Lactobacillus sp. CBA3606]|uniref:aggregation-promoting factor n=1 Tax=Lactobacillus sp. CBA3606 TaxID=2099789 RepID=UPI000CFCB691|nr:LysM domain-containing protein [Lactobacillus sp. CBA3606]AVK64292.1 LysM domain-containing protein [Lactobacillus sp. CBA3606]
MKIKNVLLSTAAAASGLFAIGATAQAATVTVKAGDTVSAIANENDTTVAAIEKANQLTNVNLIFVGQKLEVNDTTATTTPATSTTTQTQTQSTTTTTPSQNTTTHSTSTPAATTQSTTTTATNTSSNTSSSDSSAKAWIANKESGGSYGARNGQYVGKYQLSASYLNGDYSAANQERVANNYVSSRYGSWSQAKSHWLSTGWY